MQYILLILASLLLFGGCGNFQSNSRDNVSASEYREYELSKSEVAPGAEYEPAGYEPADYEPAGYGYGDYEYARSVVTPPAANAYKRKFKQLDDDIAKLVKMINEHATDLNEMAREYEAAENQNTNASNSLSGDVIV